MTQKGVGNSAPQTASCDQRASTTGGGNGGITGYEVIAGSEVSGNALQIRRETLDCPAGKRVLSGGFSLDSGNVEVDILESSPNGAGTAWILRYLVNGGGVTEYVGHSYVICANATP
ncbi:hypothetical protein [Streptomyces phaeofaciens]|uniref:hypothetical protein n=1 Tax=Streptomyces phaeofaciens TaxID=68254 RepID=UPI0036B38D79